MADRMKTKKANFERRHRRVRSRVSGNAGRPRLVVSRSLKHVRAEIVDDENGKTILQVSSTWKELPSSEGEGSMKMRRSIAVGAEVARRAAEKGIKRVAFDRGGCLYHGRIRAVAEAARKGGLEF